MRPRYEDLELVVEPAPVRDEPRSGMVIVWLAEKRAEPRVEEPWRAEYREAIRRQYEVDAA